MKVLFVAVVIALIAGINCQGQAFGLPSVEQVGCFVQIVVSGNTTDPGFASCAIADTVSNDEVANGDLCSRDDFMPCIDAITPIYAECGYVVPDYICRLSKVPPPNEDQSQCLTARYGARTDEINRECGVTSAADIDAACRNADCLDIVRGYSECNFTIIDEVCGSGFSTAVRIYTMPVLIFILVGLSTLF